MSKEKFEGAIDIKEGVNIAVTEDSGIMGLKILNTSKKVSLNLFYYYEIFPEFFKQLT